MTDWGRKTEREGSNAVHKLLDFIGVRREIFKKKTSLLNMGVVLSSERYNTLD